MMSVPFFVPSVLLVAALVAAIFGRLFGAREGAIAYVASFVVFKAIVLLLKRSGSRDALAMWIGANFIMGLPFIFVASAPTRLSQLEGSECSK